MASLKIRTFKGGATEPATTITIPLAIIRFAAKIMPKHATSALQEKGIDVDLIVELSQNKDIRGTLVEIEEHKKNEKTIISVE
ncbi:MAG: hypothetical protein BBJ57_04335 [Desulfobacterales bacterium PC51MH44]|jgi:hypothetical protein|nr:MAG: hypothetical protein BBJ57_04335 [Desulfobacterales bacterium PC51MH44]